MSKAKFNAQEVDQALSEFLASVAPTEVPGLGYNGDITVYRQSAYAAKGKSDGQSKGPIDGYLEDVQPGLDSE
jgi:hypothetical protein